jgi:hypothetical protein
MILDEPLAAPEAVEEVANPSVIETARSSRDTRAGD